MLSRCSKSINSSFFYRSLHCRQYSTNHRNSNSVFRDAKAAKLLAIAGAASSIPELHGLPEIVVTGRANVGKSSLLNAMLGRRDLLYTGKKAGRTRTMNFFQVGVDPGQLVVVDAPGYGSRGRPEWGHTFDHYIENRRVLRRVFVLLNGKHDIHDADLAMLRSLHERSQSSDGRFTLQAVVTKVDLMPTSRAQVMFSKMRHQISEAAPMCLPLILTSARTPQFGIEEIRLSTIQACSIAE